MIKAFYAPRIREKTFFGAGVTLCSTAYGREVAEEYRRWLNAYEEKWNGRKEHYLLLEQGNIFLNAAKTDGFAGEVMRADAHIVRSDSALAPLMFRKSLYEVTRTGILKVDGVPRFAIGSELKAWAILALPAEEKAYLLVDGKRPGGTECRLSFYPIGQEAENAPCADLPLETVLEKKSELSVFGRHIFLTHGGVLRYYYLAPDTEKPEETAIGKGGETYTREILSPVVASKDGCVYWISGRKVCAMEIGRPSAVRTIETDLSHTVLSVASAGDLLLLYTKARGGRRECFAYRREGGSYAAVPFCAEAEQAFALSAGREGVYPLVRAGGRLAVSPAGRPALDLGEAETAFCCYGRVLADVRYAWTDGREITALK